MKREKFWSSMKRCPQKTKMLNWSSLENVFNKFSLKEKLCLEMYFINKNYIIDIQRYYELFFLKYAVFMWCIIIYVLKSYVIRTICNLNNLPIFFDQFHNFGTCWEWVIQQFTTVNFFFFSYFIHIPYKKCLKNFIRYILYVYWKLYPHNSTGWPTKMYPFFFVNIFKDNKYFLFTLR